MTRTLLNFVLDALLLAVFIVQCVTSVIVRFIFPAGTLADRWTLWDLDYDAWVNVWFDLTAVLALGVLLHLMLHWSWVCGVVGQQASKFCGRTVRIGEASQTVYGVGLLVVLCTLAGAVVAAASLAVVAG